MESNGNFAFLVNEENAAMDDVTVFKLCVCFLLLTFIFSSTAIAAILLQPSPNNTPTYIYLCKMFARLLIRINDNNG